MAHHNKIYGHTFHNVRIQKHLPLSFFKNDGIDKASLLRFERGDSTMSIERVDTMLQSMNVSLAEYELMLNHFVPDYQEAFLQEIEEADFLENKKKLRNLTAEAQEENFKELSLAAKSCAGKLSDEESDYLTQFLNGIDEWGYFELSLVYLALNNLKSSEIMLLISKFEDRNRNYFEIFKYRRRILQIIYRAATLFAARGEQEIAKKILDRSKNRSKERDMYIINLRHLAEGFYIYRFEDKIKGRDKINHALDIFEELDSTALKKYYLGKFEWLKSLS